MGLVPSIAEIKQPEAEGNALYSDYSSLENYVARSPERIAALDGLRAVAFLAVFIFHLGIIQANSSRPVFLYNEIVHWCFLGVDLFFIISGYIITKLLLREKMQHGAIDIKHFFQRRIIRIWPLYYLTISVSLLGTLLFAKRNFDFNLFTDIFKKVYLPLDCFWYIMPQTSTEAIARLTEQTRFPVIHSIAPLWSLCVEEQFYLIWPWCVMLARTRQQLLACLLAMVAVSELSRAAGFPSIPGFFYHNPISRITPLAIGIVFAIAESDEWKALKFVKLNGYLALAAACVSGSILFGPAHGAGIKLTSMFPYYLVVVTALGGFFYVCLTDDLCKRVLSISSLQTIGRYSFSMYLAHFPILFVTRPVHWTLIADPVARHILWAAISFALTFLVGKSVYYLLEQPLNRVRSRFR